MTFPVRAEVHHDHNELYSPFNSAAIGCRLAPRLTCTTRTPFVTSSTMKKTRYT